MSSNQPKQNDRQGLIAELRRRRVFRVTGTYVLVAWILMQAGEIVLPAFELSNRALRLLILALAAGLPLVTFLAWLLDVTPGGIRITQRLRREASDAGSGNETNQAEEETSESLGAVSRSFEMILLGMGLPIFAFATLFIALSWHAGDDAAARSDQAAAKAFPSTLPSLAVLPLEDLSNSGDDGGFFAQGMHEDILNSLSHIQGIKLISRTSVLGYAGTKKSIREIARELGVDHILEGSVRRTATHVRVTAQLIQTESDEHVWAEQFDDELKNVFDVQTRIARSIAGALEAELAPSSVGRSEKPASVVPVAYDAYLKARDLHRNLDAGDRATLKTTQRLYEEARRLDPGLGVAWLQLGILHAEIRWFGFDPSVDRAQQARRCLDRAREIGVEGDQLALAEGIFAYYVDADLGKALLHFNEAAAAAPGSSQAHFYRAMILRRSGELDAAIEAQRVALELDPLNLGQQDEYALTLAMAGRLSEAREVLIDILHRDPNRTRARLQKWQLDLELDGRPDALLGEMLAADREAWDDPDYTLLATVSILAGDPQAAYDVLIKRHRPHLDSGHRNYQLAVLAGMAGREEEKNRLLSVARAEFDELMETVPLTFPESNQRRIRALFALEERDYETALRLSKRSAEALPIERDLVVGAPPLWDLLDVQLQAGRVEEAAHTLERLDSHIALGSIPFAGYYVLTHQPAFALPRESPAFSIVLEKLRPDYTRDWIEPN